MKLATAEIMVAPSQQREPSLELWGVGRSSDAKNLMVARPQVMTVPLGCGVGRSSAARLACISL
jgi:hypothetical protein